MYYLRTRAASEAIKFTVDMEALKQSTSDAESVASLSPTTSLDLTRSTSNSAFLPPSPTVSAEPSPTSSSSSSSQDAESWRRQRELEAAKLACAQDNGDACVMCSG